MIVSRDAEIRSPHGRGLQCPKSSRTPRDKTSDSVRSLGLQAQCMREVAKASACVLRVGGSLQGRHRHLRGLDDFWSCFTRAKPRSARPGGGTRASARWAGLAPAAHRPALHHRCSPACRFPCAARKKRRRSPDDTGIRPEHCGAPNLPQRELGADAPNRKWRADSTCVWPKKAGCTSRPRSTCITPQPRGGDSGCATGVLERLSTSCSTRVTALSSRPAIASISEHARTAGEVDGAPAPTPE